jgi:hypothetical protein
MDGNHLTVEYQTGDSVYAVARANPTYKMVDRNLDALVRCSCGLLRLGRDPIPGGFGPLCDDARRR